MVCPLLWILAYRNAHNKVVGPFEDFGKKLIRVKAELRRYYGVLKRTLLRPYDTWRDK
jgi:hypothetical protein